MNRRPQADHTPPYFAQNYDEYISLSLVSYNEKYASIKVEVNGLFDDHSRIKSIKILMESEEDYFRIHSPRRLLEKLPSDVDEDPNRYKYLFYDSDQPGRYVYYNKQPIFRNRPGNYRIRKVRLEDEKGNEVEVQGNFNDDGPLFFPGKRLLIRKKDAKHINEALEIRTSKAAEGGTIAHVLTTDMRHFYLHAVKVKIRDTESGHEMTYLIDADRLSLLNAQLGGPSVSGKMNLPIVIPKELESGKYRLVWISFLDMFESYAVRLSKSNSRAYFDHISHEEDSSVAQPGCGRYCYGGFRKRK